MANVPDFDTLNEEPRQNAELGIVSQPAPAVVFLCMVLLINRLRRSKLIPYIYFKVQNVVKGQMPDDCFEDV